MPSVTIASSVTNQELGADVAVQSLVILLLAGFAARNIVKLLKDKEKNRRCRRAAAALVMILLLIPMIRFFDIEIRLLLAPQYATGTTLGFCQVFIRGRGIEFRYEVDGITYTNCDTFHPLTAEEIDVPQGLYAVRYSRKHPEKGRMDFRKSDIN